MSDGLRSESWRPQRRESSFDPQIKRMGAIAGGVAVVLALGYGGYAMVGRAPRAVPVIEADSRPLRVRPDNPGGMQVAGAEEQIMGGAGSGAADAMAPAPEIPQPQVLRAQIQAARQPPPAPAQPAPPVQPVSLTAAPVLPAVIAAPEQRPAPAVKPPAAHAALPAPVGSTQAGGTEVQLAAMDSEGAAAAEWQRLSKRIPELLSSHRPAVLRAERDGKAIFRLRTGGFTDVAQATSFCTQLRAKGIGCAIASF